MKPSTSNLPSGIAHVSIAALEPNPFNVRVSLDEASLAGLAKSIEARGLIHPILVRPHPDPERFGNYQIVCGERRFSAIRMLHRRDPERWAEVAVRVENLDDTAALAAIMQENELRQDWTPYERAAFFRAVYDDRHFPSIRKMAKSFGIGLTTLHRYLRIFDLPPGIVADFRQGKLTVALLEVILEAPKPIQRDLAQILAARPCGKEEARRIARQLSSPADNDWIDLAVTKLSDDAQLTPLPGGRLRIALEADSASGLAAKLTAIAQRLS